MPPHTSAPKKLLLAGVLLLAAFLRLYQLTTIPPPLHFDEAMNGNDAMENIELGRILPFYPQNGGREGLYINIETALIYFFGPEPWLLRLPAAIFGILTVWGVYLLAAALFDEPIALLAAFFIATSFWHIMFSRLGLRAIGAPLFAVWTVYFLLRATSAAIARRPYLRDSVIAGVLCGLGFYTYIAYRIILALVAAVLLYGYLEARRAKAVPALVRVKLAFIGATVIGVVPLAIYFFQHPDALLHRSAEVSIFHAPNPAAEFLSNIWKTTQMIFSRGDFDWHYNIAFHAAVFWPVAVLFVLGIIVAARAGGFANLLLLFWLGIGALPALLTGENMPSLIRSIMMIPPLFMLAALGAAQVWEWVAPQVPRQALAAAAALLFAFVAVSAYRTYFVEWAGDPNVPVNFDAASVEIADHIKQLPLTAPKYVVAVTPGAGFGMPAPAQTVMFLTRSYTAKQRRDANIHYIIRQPGDREDGFDFCRKVAIQYRQNVFCLQVNQKKAPSL